MYLLKIFLLLLPFSLQIQARNQHESHPFQDNTRRVNRPSDDNGNCFCFPDVQSPTVLQLLDPQNQGQERLVLYLYRNVGTNEIKMFTPNPEKQKLIPEIPFEPHDALIPVTTENVGTLFTTNPYKVVVNDDQTEPFSLSVTESFPIGLNTGSIETIYPNEEINVATPSNSYVNEYPIDISNGDFASGHQKVTVPRPVNTATVIANPVPSHQKLNIGNMYSQTLESYWPSNTLNYPHPNVQTSSESALYPEGLDYNVYSFQTNPGNPFTIDSNNIPHYPIYVTFDLWFNQQMKRFQNINLPNDVNPIDSDILKFMVQKTLSDNNIYVSAEGIIRDSQENVIDPSNIELRPLLLGEKVSYQILNNLPKSVVLRKDFPFLEGILVALISPPQILGIIPLGKTYLLQTSQLKTSLNGFSTLNESQVLKKHLDSNNWAYYNPSTVTIKEAYSSTSLPAPIASPSYQYSGANSVPQSANEVPYWSSSPYSTNLALEGRRKLSDVKIEHMLDAPVKNKKSEKVDKSKEGIVTEPFVNITAPESGRRFPIPGIKTAMKTLLYLLNDSRKAPPSNSTNVNVDILNESENINNGEGPDFRIIGGNAATGSGTPLSNKGRTGFTE